MTTLTDRLFVELIKTYDGGIGNLYALIVIHLQLPKRNPFHGEDLDEALFTRKDLVRAYVIILLLYIMAAGKPPGRISLEEIIQTIKNYKYIEPHYKISLAYSLEYFVRISLC